MRKCHVSTDPKKGKGQPTQDQEKWNLKQRNNSTNSAADHAMTDQGKLAQGPRGARGKGPHRQQCAEGVKGQLTLELDNEKTLHFGRNLYQIREGQKHAIHQEILPATPREDKDLNQNSHTRENDVDSLKTDLLDRQLTDSLWTAHCQGQLRM